jgi:hypothetical protein
MASRNRLRQFNQPLEKVSGLGLVNAIFNYNGKWHAIADRRGDGWAHSMLENEL